MARSWRVALVVISYLAAAAGANLAVGFFGRSALPFTAFFLIPFDMIARDVLFDAWAGRGVFIRMAALVVGGSAIAYLTSESSLRVSLASAGSFLMSGGLAVCIYAWLRQRGFAWWSRANIADVFGAVADSIIFPALAFGIFETGLSTQQAAIKIAGGAFWVLALKPVRQRILSTPRGT